MSQWSRVNIAFHKRRNDFFFFTTSKQFVSLLTVSTTPRFPQAHAATIKQRASSLHMSTDRAQSSYNTSAQVLPTRITHICVRHQHSQAPFALTFENKGRLVSQPVTNVFATRRDERQKHQTHNGAVFLKSRPDTGFPTMLGSPTRARRDAAFPHWPPPLSFPSPLEQEIARHR